ncbi:MAG: GNAT family N-acetyltransferase, partial [Candidatus Dadabacteria bacterium]|nr:GNAT family N-acetyltransferase [Candidatus Dadabacteria bacterium]
MPIDHKFIRIKRFYDENGLLKTVRQFFSVAIRDIFKNRFIIFYAELTQMTDDFILPDENTVVCRSKEEELSEQEMNSLYFHRGREIISYQLGKRFKEGAIIWFIKMNETPLGFIWSIRQKTIQPYFFPMCKNDVHLFDNEIFKEYRGKGINRLLIGSTLFELKRRGMVRAFIETGIWNKPEIRSLAKTEFNKLGMGSKMK